MAEEQPKSRVEKIEEQAAEEVEKVAEEIAEAPQQAADEILAEAEQLEHTPPVERFEARKEKLVEAVENVAPSAEETPEVLHAAEEQDTTTIFGRTIPYPVYTVIFVGLGVLTLLEVLVGTSGDSFFRIPILLAIAIVKASLVVLYYMHLKRDSRVYRWVIGLPLIVALVAVIYLLSVPPVAYGS